MTPTVKSLPERIRFAWWRGCLPLLAFAWLLPSASGAERKGSEAEVKAAALSKIGDYARWPAGTFADARSPVVIGVMGRNLFEEELSEIVKIINENGAGHRLIVRQFKDDEPVENCQILFIAASEKARVPQIIQRVQGKAVLTISDLDGYVTRQGGCLRLFVEDKALQFEVNLTAVEREKITFNTGFLGLKGTRIIRDGKVVK